MVSALVAFAEPAEFDTVTPTFVFTNLFAPKVLQLCEVLVCVVLDSEVQGIAREAPDPSSAENNDPRIGVADGDAVAISLGAFTDVQAHEVPECRVP